MIMMFEYIFSDDFLDYLESLPPDDRQETIRVNLSYCNCLIEEFLLFAEACNRSIDKLTGKMP